jgi:anti-sigma regulatory factor (Ser/Thr protein kinase)/putative methionine-R-sulfoxide reductase with GAF domain
MPDESLMEAERPPRPRWDLLRASLARREDPYAGADAPSARRIVPLLVLLSALLTAAFLPMALPDEAIGGAGWAVAGAIVVAELVVVRRLTQGAHEATFNELLAVAYAGVTGVAVLEWLAGGHSPYMMLYLLWVGAGVGVHPPRRAAVFLLVVLAAGALPLVYSGATAGEARSIATTSLLWLAIGLVLMMLIAMVRTQRVELRTGARSARAEAEEAERRILALERIADVALGQLPLDELLQELLARLGSVLEIDAAAILLVDESGKTLVVRAAEGADPTAADGSPIRMDVGDGCAGRVAAEKRTILLDDIADSGDLDPLFRSAEVRTLLGLPLEIDGGVLGVLQVASRHPRRFSEDEMRILELAADRIARAIERTQVNERAHQIAETLQRALLPERLPEIPGVGLAARYLPGGRGTEVGGDWYDVVPYPDGRVGLVMGDVVGKGVAAAARMGQLRNGMRVYSLEHDDPAEILNRMNILLSRLDSLEMSTAVALTFDPVSHRLCFATAGHPPPIVHGPDGEARYLDSRPSVPLGIMPYGRYEAHETKLEPGATLLLYTDGLVERRDSSLTAGLNHLRAAVNGAPPEPDRLCEHVLGVLLPQGPPGDDVALLALRNEPITGASLHLELANDPDELAVIRRSMERWLESSHVHERDAYRVTAATNEACMNAIEHGFASGAPGFEVRAELSDSEVDVVVRDRGHWREPRSQHDGRGLEMMRSLMDDVEVMPGDEGTTVRLRRAIRREAFP